jgi:hypothetical protein
MTTRTVRSTCSCQFAPRRLLPRTSGCGNSAIPGKMGTMLPLLVPPPEPRQARCLFARERARCSRTRVTNTQPARTPLHIGSAWVPAGYSLEMTRKDLQVDQSSAISVHLVAITRFNSGKASGYWKKILLHSPFIRFTFDGTGLGGAGQAFEQHVAVAQQGNG